MSESAKPGSIVICRQRQWVVLPSDNSEVVRLRPLSGNEEQICGVFTRLGLENIEPAQFDPPNPDTIQNHTAAQLLMDATRLSLRSGAGPFRCLGRLSVRPRPYQLVPLLMALRLETVRLLIADDVGIGKTIEAGLIIRELLDRGEAKRMAVLCPPQLCDQWQRELKQKFHIDAVVVRSGTVSKLERGLPAGDSHIFSYYPHLIVSLDYVKSDRRRESFLVHCPDLVIVDEAHTCTHTGGERSTQQQRHQLVQKIAAKSNQHSPIHIIGCRTTLEKRPPSGTPRLSAHGLMQEYLNRTEHLWGIVTNGLRWRLLRDCSLMTRLTYLEFDLEQILNGENFAEFGLFYRLFHRTRLPQGIEDTDECLLEFYHQETLQQGGRVRDRLRDGVERAIIRLGTGFLQHQQNQSLRQLIEENQLISKDFYRLLLFLIYRLLFLMVAESRNLLLAGEDTENVRIYREYYSIERLRALAERPSYRREGFQDIWQGLIVTFALFNENWRGEVLGLSPLNGDLFGEKTLKILEGCGIDNHDLLISIRELSLYENKGQLRRVNYGALNVEELGSVYESLLGFTPQFRQQNGVYEFVLVIGSDRKTTGSYYTPPELVAQLIKSALEPVIEEKLRSLLSPLLRSLLRFSAEEGAKAQQQEEALLSLKVCDPACGSGHFLLAAARRIGKELAIIRTGESQPAPEVLRQAIRDVVQHCIYGVDLNPLAVDLCKVALWIEGFCKGLPLNFLDHRIKCGNSLVGVLDISCLDEGIPDDAFKAVTGDDKKLSTLFKTRNKKERKDLETGQGSFNFVDLETGRSEYIEKWREFAEIPETTPKEIKQKQSQYQQNHSENNQGWWA
ncbi:MAG: SNF2-related protein [Planktothrix rubescens PR222]